MDLYITIFSACIALIATLLIIVSFIQSYIAKIPELFDGKLKQDIEKTNISKFFSLVIFISFLLSVLALIQLFLYLNCLDDALYSYGSIFSFSALLFGTLGLFFKLKKLV